MARLQRHPVVPYLGLILKDLTFLNDGIPKRLEANGHVNVRKLFQIYDVLTEFDACKRLRLPVEEDTAIRTQLRRLPLPDENVRFPFVKERNAHFDDDPQSAYMASLKAEPRQAPAEPQA